MDRYIKFIATCYFWQFCRLNGSIHHLIHHRGLCFDALFPAWRTRWRMGEFSVEEMELRRTAGFLADLNELCTLRAEWNLCTRQFDNCWTLISVMVLQKWKKWAKLFSYPILVQFRFRGIQMWKTQGCSQYYYCQTTFFRPPWIKQTPKIV